MAITEYGEYDTANGAWIFTNYDESSDPTDDDDGQIVIYLNGPRESFQEGCKMDIARKVGVKRNILGKALGKSGHALSFSNLILVDSQANAQTVNRIFLNWIHSTTNFPYRFYYALTGAKGSVTYYQFPDKATTGLNTYMEGAVTNKSGRWDSVANKYFYANLVFEEANLG